MTMTAEEVVKQLMKHDLCDITGYSDEKDVEARLKAIEAVEKTIPKVPDKCEAIIRNESKIYYYCGHCGRQVFRTMFDFCPKCGYEIDWKGVE